MFLILNQDNFRKEFKRILFCSTLKTKSLGNFENPFSSDINSKSVTNLNISNKRNYNMSNNLAKSLNTLNNAKAVTSSDLLAKYNNNTNRKRPCKNYISRPDFDIELNSEVLLKSEKQLNPNGSVNG